VARALEDAGADLLACADIEEGSVLRAAGVQADILVFGALSVSDLDGVFDHDLTPTISSPAAGEALQAGAAKRNATLHYHLKIDTGMNRLGFRHDNLRRRRRSSGQPGFAAVYTHFGPPTIPAARCSTSSVCD
jgi:alanine racemase